MLHKIFRHVFRMVVSLLILVMLSSGTEVQGGLDRRLKAKPRPPMLVNSRYKPFVDAQKEALANELKNSTREALASFTTPEWLLSGAAKFMLAQKVGSSNRPQTRFRLILKGCRGKVSRAADGSLQITDIVSDWSLRPGIVDLPAGDIPQINATIRSMPSLESIRIKGFHGVSNAQDLLQPITESINLEIYGQMLKAACQMGAAASKSATARQILMNAGSNTQSPQPLNLRTIELYVPSASYFKSTADGVEWIAVGPQKAGEL